MLEKNTYLLLEKNTESNHDTGAATLPPLAACDALGTNLQQVVEVEGGGDHTQEAELTVGAGESVQLHGDEDGRGLAVQREAEGASGRGRGVVLCPNCCCSMQRAAGGLLELQGSAHRRDGWVHGGGVGAPWRAVAAAY